MRKLFFCKLNMHYTNEVSKKVLGSGININNRTPYSIQILLILSKDMHIMDCTKQSENNFKHDF